MADLISVTQLGNAAELPATVNDFLAAQNGVEVVLLSGSGMQRTTAAKRYPSLTTLKEGPRILALEAGAKRIALEALRVAHQGVTAHVIVPLESRACHLSAVQLDGGEVLVLFHDTNGIGEITTAAAPKKGAAMRAICDLSTEVASLDRDLADVIGFDADSIENTTLLQLVAPESVDLAIDGWIEAITNGISTRRVQMLGPDRKPGRWFQAVCMINGDQAHLLFLDVTDDVQAALLLEQREEDLRQLAETIPLGIFRATTTGKLLYRNAKLHEVFGIDGDGDLPIQDITTLDGRPIADALSAELEDSAETQMDVQLPIGDTMRAVRLRVHGYRNALGEFEVVGSAEDISSELERRETLQIQALTDPVTGTANRRSLELGMGELLDTVGTQRFAVLLCDLDGFKQVNDSLGHEAGDAVISEVGSRLKTVARTNDIVARLGGDEFVVVARDIPDYGHAMEFAERVLPALRKPFDHQGGQIELSGSIGVAVSAPDSSVLSLLQMADHAMYEAKRSGRNQARPYQSAESGTALSPLALRRDLRRAISADDLDLAFQPIYLLDDMSGPRAAEALLRWTHPVQGYIPPSMVIPVAEQSGLIRELGDWILSAAIQSSALVNRHSAVKHSVTISVNLSAIQLGRPDFAESVHAALDFYGVTADQVAFELTESYLVDQVENARATLHKLHQLGVKLAVDDFGTGYSTFDYLLSLPIDAVKIDPSFTQRLLTPRAAAMMKGLASACRELDMLVIVEGVENEEQLVAAREAGATHAQGFYLGRPVSIDGLGADRAAGDVAA